MLNLTKDNFDSTIAKGKALVDFYTDWCGHCRIIAPVIEELSVKYADSVVVAKVDADSQSELAKRYGINTYPTVVLFEGGKETAREIGSHPMEVFEEMLGASSQAQITI